MEYKIINNQYLTTTCDNNLEHKVQEFISKGWKPQGGIVASMGYYYQAMIKEDPVKNGVKWVNKEDDV